MNIKKIYFRRLVLLFLGLSIFFTIHAEATENNRLARLLRADRYGDSFGSSVAISGDFAIVSASFDIDNGSAAGAAYIYRKNNLDWVLEKKIYPSDPHILHEFAGAVAIDGDYAVVGTSHDTINGIGRAGSAYIFHRYQKEDGTYDWEQQAKITASDPSGDARFGNSVSISDHYIVVGSFTNHDPIFSRGAAYIFEQVDGYWIQKAKLIGSDSGTSSHFGISVSIDGTYVVVGAQEETVGTGSAYVFERLGETWTEVQKLTASDKVFDDRFGYSVSIDANNIVVGAYNDDINSITDVGSAYIFERTARGWIEKYKLTASDGTEGDMFGNSVSIDGDNIVVGAYKDIALSNPSQVGAAYLFHRYQSEDGTYSWEEQVRMTDSSPTYIGRTVSISNNHIVLGAYSGIAYVYTIDPLLINATSLHTGTAGRMYDYPIPIAGITTKPHTWSINSGLLPNGLTLDGSTGKISGTPITSGIFNFTIQVEDNFDPPNIVTQNLFLPIAEDNLDAEFEVESHQKVSNIKGNFSGLLDDDDRFGLSIAGLGDLDGDGVSDIAVSAPNDDDGGTDSGAVWILFLNSDRTVKSFQKISDSLSRSLANIGDLDGDGVTDIAVGDRLEGAVQIIFLNADGTVKNKQKISRTEGDFTGIFDIYDYFGSSIASLGDFNGDGVNDIAVGALGDDDGSPTNMPYWWAGSVWILFLNSDGTVKSHQKISDTHGNFTGELHARDFFGASITSLGDLDGDGVTDIAVGAYGDSQGELIEQGALWILFLNSNGTVKSHQKINHMEGNFNGFLDDTAKFGQALANLGDLDGDGLNDIAVGSIEGAPNNIGRMPNTAVRLLFLNSDGTVKSYRKISKAEGNFTGILDDFDYFGYSIASLGDIEGDGKIEIAIGASGDDDGGSDRGAVWILSLAENMQPDQDGDSIPDNTDNCTLVSNTDQRDTNNDGYGNICDPDLNNDDWVNFGDLAALKAVFGTTNEDSAASEDADLNGDGFVNFGDLAILKSYFGKPPGPSGVVP